MAVMATAMAAARVARAVRVAAGVAQSREGMVVARAAAAKATATEAVKAVEVIPAAVREAVWEAVAWEAQAAALEVGSTVAWVGSEDVGPWVGSALAEASVVVAATAARMVAEGRSDWSTPRCCHSHSPGHCSAGCTASARALHSVARPPPTSCA